MPINKRYMYHNASVFTIARTWKQPKCPSTDEWIKKMRYISISLHTHTNGILLSHENEWNFAICNNMDGLGGCYAKWNKSDRERQILYEINYMWNLKKYNKLVNITKNKQTYRYREQTSGYQLWGQNIGVGEWEAHTVGCKMVSRMYFTTQGI